jgi:hypothetical protein
MGVGYPAFLIRLLNITAEGHSSKEFALVFVKDVGLFQPISPGIVSDSNETKFISF